MRVKRGFASVTIYRVKHPKTASGFIYTVAWTINTARKRLVTLWRWARVKRYLSQDMMTEAERIQFHKEDAKRREIMTVEEFARTLIMLRVFHPDHLIRQRFTILRGAQDYLL